MTLIYSTLYVTFLHVYLLCLLDNVTFRERVFMHSHHYNYIRVKTLLTQGIYNVWPVRKRQKVNISN